MLRHVRFRCYSCFTFIRPTHTLKNSQLMKNKLFRVLQSLFINSTSFHQFQLPDSGKKNNRSLWWIRIIPMKNTLWCIVCSHNHYIATQQWFRLHGKISHISICLVIRFEYDGISKIPRRCMKVIFHMIGGIIRNSTHPYANILKE